MPRPFALTVVYPQIIPQHNRGTYFIDMGHVYRDLPDQMRRRIAGTFCVHSPRRYVKIRPSDVYRPVIDVLADIERETPEVKHPTAIEHPITGETILYVSAAIAHRLESAAGNDLGEGVLHDLLEFSGQLDTTFTSRYIHFQTYEPRDIVIWDNRSLIHCARHTPIPEPAESLRITLHDHAPYYVSRDANTRASANV
jgi:taurine dioxygenase